MVGAPLRYVAWIERNTAAILVGCALVFLAAAYHAAYDLPLRADFTYLLPANAPAVHDAEKLAARTPARDTMLVLIVAADAERRAVAAAQATAAIERIGAEYIERVEADDAELRAFISAHRYLFVPLAELEHAREVVALRKNPLLVDLEDDELHAKQQAAEARLARSAHISADGKSQVLIIRTAFRATDVDRDIYLMNRLEAIAADVTRETGVTVGFAGGPTVTVAEHAALSRGIMLSSVITFVLVALLLLVHLRSVRILALVSANSSSRPSSRSGSRRSPSDTSTPRPPSSARSSRATVSTTASCSSHAISRSAASPTRPPRWRSPSTRRCARRSSPRSARRSRTAHSRRPRSAASPTLRGSAASAW
jgi:hypothetical protein